MPSRQSLLRFSGRNIAGPGLALALCAVAPAASAQVMGQNDNAPISIQSDSGIEWDQNAHRYVARGNAVATRGPGEVHADTLIAYYREIKGSGAAAKPDTTKPETTNPGATNAGATNPGKTGGGATNTGDSNTEIYRVEAEGHVTLKRNDQTVVGDHADYDIDQSVSVVKGKNLKLTTPSDTVTARDSLEWYEQKQVAVARGDAVAIRNGKMVKGDILTAYMIKSPPPGTAPGKPGAPPAAAGKAPAPVSGKPGAPAAPGKTPATFAAAPGKPAPGAAAAGAAAPGKPPDGESKISRVDAQGHVVVSNAIDTGKGDFGVYNTVTGIATLIGNVVIERGKDVIRGQRGVMDLNNNVSRMLPGGGPEAPKQRVQGLFIKQDQNARPGGAAAPAGSATAASPTPAGTSKP